MYPLCGRCNLRHPRYCLATLDRCFICLSKGHRWKDYQYLGRECFYCEDASYKKRDCPRKKLHRVSSSRLLLIDLQDLPSLG